MKHIYTIIVIGLLATGCPHNDGCATDTMRCFQNHVEICNGGQMWQSVENCDAFELDGEPVSMECVEFDTAEPECVEVEL